MCTCSVHAPGHPDSTRAPGKAPHPPGVHNLVGFILLKKPFFVGSKSVPIIQIQTQGDQTLLR